MNFYTDFFNFINSVLQTFTSTATQNITQQIQPTLISLMIISIGIMGWSMITGLIQEPIMQTIKKMLEMAVIYAFAINSGIHNEFIVNFFWQLPDALASAVINNTGSTINIVDGSSSSIQFLDALYTKFDTLSTQFDEQATIFTTISASLNFTILSYAVSLAGGLLTASAFVLLLLSKIMLSILLALSPIFIAFLYFASTRRFFEQWITQVMNYVFLPVLIAAALSVILTAFEKYFALIPPDGATKAEVLPLIILSLATAFLFSYIPQVASHLGGGVALNTQKLESWVANKAARAASGTVGTTARTTERAIGYGVTKGIKIYKNRNGNSIEKDN